MRERRLVGIALFALTILAIQFVPSRFFLQVLLLDAAITQQLKKVPE